jgi:hypothetical protein
MGKVTTTDAVRVPVSLDVHPVCACGNQNCDHPKCPECRFLPCDMVSLVSEPSLRVCDCGRVYRLQTCDTAIDEADRRRRGIGPDCWVCHGTGHGRTSDFLCGRCKGRGYDLIREEVEA